MYSVIKFYLHTFVFNILWVFLMLFIYIINIGYWQVLFIIQEQLEKSQSVTSTFKCRGSTAAVLVFLKCIFTKLGLDYKQHQVEIVKKLYKTKQHPEVELQIKMSKKQVFLFQLDYMINCYENDNRKIDYINNT